MPPISLNLLNLKKEFEWFLKEEVHRVLNQTHSILVDCAYKFPVALYGNEACSKQTKYILSSPYEHIKCWLVISGDNIGSAEISFKPLKHIHGVPHNSLLKISIHPENPWKLQQVQDAANYLQQALDFLDDVDRNYNFKSANEVLHVLNNVIDALERSKNSLIIPKKKAIEQLMKSSNMKCLQPNLPEDIAVSFFLQSYKLICAVYQIKNSHGTMKFDLLYAECLVPWLNEILAFISVASQLCQELKDKVAAFAEHKDFKLNID